MTFNRDLLQMLVSLGETTFYSQLYWAGVLRQEDCGNVLRGAFSIPPPAPILGPRHEYRYYSGKA